MTREEKQAWLYLKHSCGKLTLKDDPVLMRLTVKTERQASDECKADVARFYPGYAISYEIMEGGPGKNRTCDTGRIS